MHVLKLHILSLYRSFPFLNYNLYRTVSLLGMNFQFRFPASSRYQFHFLLLHLTHSLDAQFFSPPPAPPHTHSTCHLPSLKSLTTTKVYKLVALFSSLIKFWKLSATIKKYVFSSAIERVFPKWYLVKSKIICTFQCSKLNGKSFFVIFI